MSAAGFVHLHVHTTYSLLDGACKIEPLIEKAARLGMPAVAITDHGNLYGLKHFYDVCNKNKIKPILGCEAYISDEPYTSRTERGHHLILLAKNLKGYHNLVSLISEAFINGFYYHARIDKQLLEKYKEGLIVSSACIAGEIARYIDKDDIASAEKTAMWFKERFGEDYYLEMMLHPMNASDIAKQDSELGESSGAMLGPKNGDDSDSNKFLAARQRKVNAGVLAIGKKLGIKCIVTNDVHFLDEDDADAHDILLCVSTGQLLSDKKRLRYTRQEWFKSAEEMTRIFPDNSEQIANTLEIADKVEAYKLESDPIMPVFPIPVEFGTEALWREKFDDAALAAEFGEDKLQKQGAARLVRIKLEADYLESLVMKGAHARWPLGIDPETISRIKFELGVIKLMGFPGYFLIVQDFIAAARDMGVVVGPGRGSAAGSVVAYCLRITNIDPIKFDLLFERFLNPDRISMPDIDVDFDDDGRPRVLDWVVEKYGADHVAHIATFGSMAPRGAIKDVMRVMGKPLADSAKLSSMVPNTPKITMQKALLASPELHDEFDGKGSVPDSETILQLASKLDGTLRQTGVHACGVIISRDPLVETIPVMPTKDDALFTTQYDGHFVESIGLIKMDFLGLKTLTVIRNCLETIKECRGENLDIDSIPLDDKMSLDVFARGDTTGLFQFESEGMRMHLKALKPDVFDNLVVMNALYRPGPMAYIPQYIARKHGKEPVEYDHPMMAKYLKETYGITVYQEQVMLLSRLLGGFTRGESDSLRKAMGKKKLAEMEKLFAKFESGCLANKEFRAADCAKNEADARKLIAKIWEDWRAFASYAFNKSHAVCYAYVAYQTGYLKAHYPVEFMCAQITSEIGNFDKLPILVSSTANEMGISVLPPNVNKSVTNFVPENGDCVRYGLAGIKGVGQGATESLVAERTKNGPFKNLSDFCKRIDTSKINKKAIESLARCGALDCLGMHRAAVVANIDMALDRGAADRMDRESGQTSIFDLLGGDSSGAQSMHEDFPDVPQWTSAEILANERDYLGVYVSGHPLLQYAKYMRGFTNVSDLADKIDDLKPDAPRVNVKLLTMIVAKTSRVDKNGKPWAIITVEDVKYSRMEALVFARTFEQYSARIEVDKPVMVCGCLQRRSDDSSAALIVNEIHPVDSIFGVFAGGIRVEADENMLTAEKIEGLKEWFNRDGKVMSLSVHTNNGSNVLLDFNNMYRMTPSEVIFNEIETQLGFKVAVLPSRTCSPDEDANPRRRWGNK